MSRIVIVNVGGLLIFHNVVCEVVSDVLRLEVRQVWTVWQWNGLMKLH
jgi:hypothetical protein